jgi:hypothetical protein
LMHDEPRGWGRQFDCARGWHLLELALVPGPRAVAVAGERARLVQWQPRLLVRGRREHAEVLEVVQGHYMCAGPGWLAWRAIAGTS